MTQETTFKAAVIIEGYKTKFGFNLNFYKGDLENGPQLRQYLNQFYRLSSGQKSALNANRFKIEYIN